MRSQDKQYVVCQYVLLVFIDLCILKIGNLPLVIHFNTSSSLNSLFDILFWHAHTKTPLMVIRFRCTLKAENECECESVTLIR